MHTTRTVICAMIVGMLIGCALIVVEGKNKGNGVPGGMKANGEELVFDVADGQLIHIVPVGADLGSEVRSDTNNFLIVPLTNTAAKTWLLNEIKSVTNKTDLVKLPLWQSYPLSYIDTNGVTKMRRKADVTEIKKQLATGGIIDVQKAMPRADVIAVDP